MLNIEILKRQISIFEASIKSITMKSATGYRQVNYFETTFQRISGSKYLIFRCEPRLFQLKKWNFKLACQYWLERPLAKNLLPLFYNLDGLSNFG